MPNTCDGLSSDVGDAEDESRDEGQRTPYSSDQPITSSDQDRFGRWPFAKRIAETLAERLGASSIVVGLYGP